MRGPVLSKWFATIYVMARIRSTGGIATMQKRPSGNSDSGGLSVSVRLFAKTELGLLAIEPRLQSYCVGIPREVLGRRGRAYEIEGLCSAPRFMADEVGEGRLRGPWSGVMAELKRTLEIETDHETLQALSFELLTDRELADRMPR